jgi:hypothetical protein
VVAPWVLEEGWYWVVLSPLRVVDARGGSERWRLEGKDAKLGGGLLRERLESGKCIQLLAGRFCLAA